MGIDIRIHIDLSPRQKKIIRGAVVTGAVIAALGIGVAIAAPIDTSWIVTGNPLTATQLKGDMDGLQTQITGDGGVQAQIAALQAQLAAVEDGGIPVITPWTSYTPTLTTLDNQPVTGGQATGFYRRVGDTMEFQIAVGFTAQSASTSSESWQLSLPSGVNYSGAKGLGPFGYGTAYNGVLFPLSVANNGNGQLYLSIPNSTGAFGLTTGSPSGGFGAGFGFAVRGSVPIANWNVTR